MNRKLTPTCKSFCRSFLPALIITLFSFNASSQTLFSEGFEDGAIPAGWSMHSYTVNGSLWIPNSWDSHTGTYSLYCFPNVTNATSWLFTKALNLQAGKFYLLSGYYKLASAASLKITIGTGADGTSQQKTIHNNFATGGFYTLVNDTIICEQSGTYYLGFENNSATNLDCAVSIDDISLSGLDIPACNAVAAGTISAPTTACANVPFTITNSNATINAPGTRYAWQQSTNGTTWTNINNGYNYQSGIVVNQTAATYYRFTDTCSTSAASSVSNQVLVAMNSYLNCYCTPAAANCATNISFTNVSILNSAINNTSTCSGGYSDFTSIGNVNAYRGQAVYIQHTINNPYNFYPYNVGVWVDINHNGFFEENEFAMSGPFTTANATSQIMIPAGALLGETRMRLKLHSFGNAVFSESCTSDPQSGETEDYKITITDAPGCSGAIAAGTVTGPAQICPNTNFYLTAANTTVNQGQIRYAWQRSTDNVNWTNINNTSYLINPLAISQNASTYYRLVDTCIASGQKSMSNAMQVTASSIFNCYCTTTASGCSVFGIDSVSFNTIHNGSTCSANGYGNYTSTLSTSVNNGTNLPFYLKLKLANSATKYVAVWIDFNRNGVFTDNERVVNTTTTGTFVSTNINIPYNVTAGEMLMRVSASNYSMYAACTTFFTGETEDYRVVMNVVNPLNKKFSYYVKKTAAGLNDGTSWTNAFTSLASAFNILQTGDTVKIAKGIYTAGAANTNSFVLKDSVIILGGFPDTGNPGMADRNFSDNQTIMSGEIGSASDATDNTKLILSASSVKGFVVDGVIVENGYCSPSSEYGPIYLNYATGTIQNCVIRNNYTAYAGSAINTVNSKLLLLNCFVENNKTEEGYANPGVFNFSLKSDISIVNSVIAKNKTELLFYQSYSNVKILNSTIFKNYGYSTVRDSSLLFLQNSIVYFNGNNYDADSTEFVADYYSGIALSNTITEVYNAAAGNYLGQNPKFVDTANIIGADNKYFTADDGLRLLNPCSPAINAGNNSLVTTNTDITGLPRIKNSTVDLGAYELQAGIAPATGVVYVKKNASGLNNGTSWQNAFTDLQSAFATCSDTIKVAKGVYPVSLTDPAASFRLVNHRVIMGGFPDTGTPTNSSINTTLYPTLIDGQVNATTKCSNIITSINNDSTCRMIGFEIINGGPPVPYYQSYYSTVKVAYKSSPYFENIKLNCLTNQASALIRVTDSSKPTFKSCTIYNGYNRQDEYDGIRQIVIEKNSAPVFLKSYFGKDTTAATATTDLGAQMLITNAGGKIDSCYFYKSVQDVVENINSNTTVSNTVFTKNNGRSIFNTASTVLLQNCVFNDSAISYYNDYNGGAVANTQQTNATFIHCNFNNSYTYRYGGAISNENSTALLKNCVFKNCSSGFNAGTIYNNTSKLTLINCIGNNSATTLNVSYAQSQFLGSGGGSNATLINCSILTSTGGGGDNAVITSGGSTDTLKVYNSILWKQGFGAQVINVGNDITTANNNNPVNCDIRNSMLFKQKNTTLIATTVGIDPKFVDQTNMEGPDKVVYSTDDGLKPCSCSQAINAGSNSFNPETTDILALNRVFNGTIDIGAYEVQSAPTTNKTFYVKENAAAGGNGASWATAYNRLQSAVLNNCADTIKIAKGTYKPATASRDSSFNLYRYLVMLGGYPNTGNPGDGQRDQNANPTILSGDIGTVNDSTDNSYSVIVAHCPDTTVLLDGVIIEKGNSNQVLQYITGGGGIYAIGNNQLNIRNCIFRNNYARFNYGAGIYTTWSNLDVNKTVFTNNTGGAFYDGDYYTTVNGYAWSPAVNFRNSVIAYNKGAGVISGSGVVAYQTGARFENVIVYKNEGGFGFGDNPYVTITNCLFARNNATTGYPGIAVSVSNPYTTLTLNTKVQNTIFYGNTINGQVSNYLNPDFNWQNSGATQETIPYLNLAYSAIAGNQTSAGGPANISSGTVSFVDIENGPGNDGIWMTADDGVLPTTTSGSINHGSNGYVTGMPLDILDSARIRDTTVDIGPYEATFNVAAPVCPPTGSVTITSAVTSPSYQWQVNTGDGNFANIANGSNYSGANTAALTITNAPSSWYGYGYRCQLQDGSYSTTTTLRFTSTWTGATSNAWEVPSNWSCNKVPDSYTDVIINSGTPVISSAVTIRTLTISSSAHITVTAGNSLTILH